MGTLAAQVAPRTLEVTRRDIVRTVLLIAGTVIVDTFVNALSAEKLNFLYKDVLRLTAGGFASLGILLNIPQYLRPFLGTLTDLVPLAGYHRRSYYAVAVLAEFVALMSLSQLPQYTYASVAALVVTQIFGIVLMFLMMEATLVRAGNAGGTTGRLQTVQQVVRYALITACTAHLSGYVTQHWSYHVCLRSAAIVTLVALPLTFLIDERRVVHKAVNPTPQQLAEQLREKREHRTRMTTALRAGARSPGIWAVIAFIFYLILTPGAGTAQFYYQVDSLHFSKQFLGDLTAYGAAGSVIGFLSYAVLCPRLPARFLVFGLVLLDCTGYVLLLMLHSRTSAIVVAVAGGAVYGWYLLGLLNLGARACPPGIEGTVYGLVYAAQFLGSTLSDKIGSTVYDHFGGAQGHSDPGWHAVLVAGIAFSLAAVVFIPFLPPWARSRAPLATHKAASL